MNVGSRAVSINRSTLVVDGNTRPDCRSRRVQPPSTPCASGYVFRAPLAVGSGLQVHIPLLGPPLGGAALFGVCAAAICGPDTLAVHSRMLVMKGRRTRRLYRAGDVNALVDVMRDAAAPRRLTIVGMLTLIGSPEAEAALFGALSDSSSLVRSTATGGLAQLDPDRDPLPVLQALRGDVSAIDEPSPEEVIDAGLYQLPRLDTVPILMRGLRSDAYPTRMMSANALAELADHRAASALADAQCDPHRSVRRQARVAFERTFAAGDDHAPASRRSDGRAAR